MVRRPAALLSLRQRGNSRKSCSRSIARRSSFQENRRLRPRSLPRVAAERTNWRRKRPKALQTPKSSWPRPWTDDVRLLPQRPIFPFKCCIASSKSPDDVCLLFACLAQHVQKWIGALREPSAMLVSISVRRMM